MDKGMPCFEWTPGTEIGDEPIMEDERRLTIANTHTEVEGQDQIHADVQLQPEILQDNLVKIDPHVI